MHKGEKDENGRIEKKLLSSSPATFSHRWTGAWFLQGSVHFPGFRNAREASHDSVRHKCSTKNNLRGDWLSLSNDYVTLIPPPP